MAKKPRSRLERPRKQASTVRFDVFRNEAPVARAGIPGDGVVSVSVDWIRRDGSDSTRGTTIGSGKLLFHIGAVDRSDHVWNRHLGWPAPDLTVGDRVEVKVSSGQAIDRPPLERWHRIRERLEPPPEGDPSRSEVKGAVVWPAPRGVYVRALNPNNGGPVALSTAEAARLARILERVATQARRPRRTRRA